VKSAKSRRKAHMSSNWI